jgi:hypothetical protein
MFIANPSRNFKPPANDNEQLPHTPIASAVKASVVWAYCFGLLSVRIAQSLIDAANVREA